MYGSPAAAAGNRKPDWSDSPSTARQLAGGLRGERANADRESRHPTDRRCIYHRDDGVRVRAGPPPGRSGAGRVWVATVARTLKISDAVALPVLEYFADGTLAEDRTEDHLGVAAHG